jgi:hypothetical protein
LDGTGKCQFEQNVPVTTHNIERIHKHRNHVERIVPVSDSFTILDPPIVDSTLEKCRVFFSQDTMNDFKIAVFSQVSEPTGRYIPWGIGKLQLRFQTSNIVLRLKCPSTSVPRFHPPKPDAFFRI